MSAPTWRRSAAYSLAVLAYHACLLCLLACYACLPCLQCWLTVPGTQGRGGEEYIPLRDYYHRHTRSLFWEISDIITFGNQYVTCIYHALSYLVTLWCTLSHLVTPSLPSLRFWFRLLCGWMMPPNHQILKRFQTEDLRKLYEDHHVVQDMLVPASKFSECLDVQHREFGVYPLWVCPMRIFPEDSGLIHPTKSGEEMFVDVGIYGTPAVRICYPLSEWVVSHGCCCCRTPLSSPARTCAMLRTTCARWKASRCSMPTCCR